MFLPVGDVLFAHLSLRIRKVFCGAAAWYHRQSRVKIVQPRRESHFCAILFFIHFLPVGRHEYISANRQSMFVFVLRFPSCCPPVCPLGSVYTYSSPSGCCRLFDILRSHCQRDLPVLFHANGRQTLTFRLRLNHTGPSVATKLWRRWRPGHKYRAGVNQIVPGIVDERGQSGFGAEKPGRIEERLATPSENCQHSIPRLITTERDKKTDARHQSRESAQIAASVVGGVLSASSSQAALWVSTRDVIWALLNAACRPEGNSGGPPETQPGVAETGGVSCADARSAICDLLAKVFCTGTSGKDGEDLGQDTTTMIGGKEASIVLDWWFEGFCSTTSPPSGRVHEGFSLPILEEDPRLLLEGMLGIPAVKLAFVERGLTRHLADALRAAATEMKDRETVACRHSQGCSRGGSQSPCELKKLPTDDRSDPCALPTTNRGQSTDPMSSQNCQRIPWWLLFSQGWGGARWGGERSHAFEDGVCQKARGTADEGSCRTALDEIFAPEAGKEDDDLTTAGNSLCSAAATPVFAAAKQQRERPEGEGAVDRSAAGGGTANGTTRARVAPPMLRLDALDSALDAKGWASARLSSSPAVMASSRASTRTASEHLVRFFYFIRPTNDDIIFLSLCACSLISFR